MISHRSLRKSFRYAFEGIFYAFKYNQNSRIHVIVALLVINASIFLQVSTIEKIILGIMILLVVASEMINTAIEEMTDLIKKEHSEEAKIAKDVSAGMVLVSSLGSVIIGLAIFIPYILNYFESK